MEAHHMKRIDIRSNSSVEANFAAGIKAKVENQGQYQEYLKELEPLREELGVILKESVYPDQQKTSWF